MSKTYTPDQNGLYNKYIVTKADGSPVEGPTFTLRPYDPHAKRALVTYARSVEKENPQLSEDLLKMVSDSCHDEEEFRELLKARENQSE